MQDPNTHNPPEWPFKLLRSFCKDSLIERIEGDVLESFDFRVKVLGVKKARLLLYRDIISMFRPFAFKGLLFKKSNHITMIFNYFKLTLRGLNTNKTTSFISIFGLAVAVSCCVILFIFGQNIITANDFIKEGNEIYMVTSNAKSASGNQFLWGKSPETLGPSIMEDIPDIESMTRYTRSSAVVRYGDKVIEESIEFVDGQFLDMFSFEVTNGNRQALKDPSRIVLSKKAADKFFGDAYPIDETLTLIIEGKPYPVTIGAVAAGFPSNTYFDFNILVSYEQKPGDISATGLAGATFLKFQDIFIHNQFRSNKSKYIQAFNTNNPRTQIENLNLIAFDQIQNHKVPIYAGVVGKENPSTLYGAIFFGLLLLFIACFNYINIALVSAGKRLKEIGLRKSVGASKGQIVVQFLTQNILLCTLAVFTGLVLAQIILLPIFNSFFPVALSINFSDPALWFFLTAVALSTGLLSGLYPAFYISAFSANEIFKGSEKFGGRKNYLFRVFLGIQFGVTFLIIFSGLAFITNSSFQRNLSWGYDTSSVLTIPTSNNEQYLAFKDHLSNYPELRAITGSTDHVGDKYSVMDILINDQMSSTRLYKVDQDYFKTLDFSLVEGEFLDENKASHRASGLIVNETFKRKYYIDNIGTNQVLTPDEKYNVIGVVEDFHYNDFYSPIDAVAFRLSSDSTKKFIIAKVDESVDFSSVVSKARQDWVRMFPDHPFTGYAQNEVFDEFFRQMSIPTNILILFAIISIILSSIGLYGLVSLALAKRMKEISIRKVMGASMRHITLITNKPYFTILLFSLIISIPVSQVLVKNYLDQVNAFHVPVDLRVVVPSTMVILMTIFLTIGVNLIKIAKARPTDALKDP